MSQQSFESLRAAPQGTAVVGMKEQRASTGNGSRFNAIKHGLTAKTPVLPGEDPAALQAKIDAYKAKYQTRDEVEDDLMEMAAVACWQVKRANRIEAHRAARDVVVRKEADALRAGKEVAGLGRRLLFDYPRALAALSLARISARTTTDLRFGGSS